MMTGLLGLAEFPWGKKFYYTRTIKRNMIIGFSVADPRNMHPVMVAL